MALKNICLFLFLISGRVALAEANLSDIKINGSLDLNYIYNFNEPAPVTPPTSSNLSQPAGNNKYRAFDLYHDDFNLALAELTVQKTTGDVKLFVALDFGHTADAMSPNDTVSKNVSQAFITYQPKRAPALSVNAGKMMTHMGLEVPKTKDNWNYSRSLLFAFATPIWHTGVAAHYSLLNEHFVPSIYVYNETSGVYETNRGKTVGAQLKVVPTSAWTVVYNFLSGAESTLDGVTHVRTLHELVTTYDLMPGLAFAADAIFGHLTKSRFDQGNAEWFAWIAALKWTKSYFSLSPRFEIFWDRSGTAIEPATSTLPGVPQRIQSSTLTASFDCGDGLETRLEFRQDRSSIDTFPTRSAQLAATQTTTTIGILYDF